MIEAKNIHKSYNNGNKVLFVLKGINLSIDIGKRVAIVGPSGAGKSTLLHILGGLDAPSQGKVFFAGEDLYGLNDTTLSRLRNKKVGFVFQFYHLLSELTVLENVLMPALINKELKMNRSELKNEALELLNHVGLSARAGHFPNQLSGGEQQRAAIARALINKPRLLLCDEPTGNLDSKTGGEIMDLIEKINLQNQMTVVLVTHNIKLAQKLDAVFHLDDGLLITGG
ncbi:MAG: ABC transporter ATP-binding protein [Candidatus Omnitrophota bacterium]